MYEIISQYLEYLELEKGLSQNTIDAYRRDLYALAERIDNISDIERNAINSYIRSLKEKNYAQELKDAEYDEIIAYGIAFYRKMCYTKLSECSD